MEIITNENSIVNSNINEVYNSTSKHETVSFLKSIYKCCEEGLVNIRILPNGKNLFIPLTEIDSISTILETYKDKNIYFGVCTRKEGDGKKKGIKQIPSIWLDKDNSSIDEVISGPWIPSLVTETSPGRYQVQWILREPLDRSEIRKVENVLKRLAIYFGGDINATDSSRVLRCPESLNHKYSPPFRVRVIYRSNSTFELSDFDDLLPPLPKLEVDLPLSTPTLAGLSGDPNLLLEDFSKRAKLHTRHSVSLDFFKALRDNGVLYKEAVTYAILYAKKVNPIGKEELDWHEYTPKQGKDALKWVYRSGPRGPSVRKIVEWIETRERKMSYLFQEKDSKTYETTTTLFNSPCGKGTILVSNENLQSGSVFRGLCNKDTCAYCSNRKKQLWKALIYKDFAAGANISIIKPGDREAWKKAAEREVAFGRIIYSGLTETLLCISNIRVKESFSIPWPELDELLDKYFQKEEKTMNGKRKVDSFGYNKRENKEVQSEPKSEERKEKKLVFFIPHDIEKLIEANTKAMTTEERILDIKNDIYFNEIGFNTDDVRRIFFSEKIREILITKVRSEGKISPCFKTYGTDDENPFEKAVLLGKW